MNTKLHILRAALCVAGCASWALTAAAETSELTIEAATDATTNVTDVLSGDLNLYINTNSTSTGKVKLSGANTYTGTTTVGGGTLEVTSLAPLGEASSLGYGTNVVFNGDYFHYSGTTAATFGHAFTFVGESSPKVRVDGDLTASGVWTKLGGTLVKTSAGTGKLTLTGSDNTFSAIKSYAGTFELAGGSTTLTGDFYLYGSTSSESADMSRLLVTGGDHTWTTSKKFLYVGYPNSKESDYWAEFLMTGGSLTLSSRNLDLGNNDDNTGTAHVKMDISGGTLTVGRRMFIRYRDGTSQNISDVAMTIRDQGRLSVAGDQYFMIYSKAGTFALTVKDGGQMTMPNICRSSTSSISPTFLVDGGTICWNRTGNVFKYSYAAIENDVLIGTKGAVFAGSASSIVATYTDVALTSPETVDAASAKGVTFQTGTHVLTVANSYAGPTVIDSDATVVAQVAGAIPQSSALTVNGTLALIQGAPLTLAAVPVGMGAILLYTDATRETLVSADGPYPVLKVPVAQMNALKKFAYGVSVQNGGRFVVAEDGEDDSLATMSLVIGGEAMEQPDCSAEGTNASSVVTFACVGEIETVGGVKYLKPNWPAHLRVTHDSAVDGLYLSGWRDETTQDFHWGDDVIVTPTCHTTYTAVFGPAWFLDSASTPKKISNGIWTFGASASGYKLTVTNVMSAPVSGDGVLNFATVFTNESGTVTDYKIIKIGTTSSKTAPFYAATYDQRMALKKLYLPETLTSGIGDYSFANCSNLAGRVTTPECCALVDESAFRACTGLTSLDLRGVTTVGQYAFYSCSGLTSVRLSENLTSLGAYSFSKASKLVTVTPFLPDGITILGREVFSSCTKLAGDLYMRGVKNIGYECFNGDKAIATSIYLPSVTNVGYQAFRNVAATNYVFGEACVNFMDLYRLPGTQYHRGNGQLTFYSDATTTRHFRFPGQAPNLPSVVPGLNAACSNQVFGTAKQNGKVIIHGSWRADPTGWNKILDEVGGATSEGGTPPTLQEDDRRVKGIFRWRNSSVSSTKASWGWLIDTKMPDEPKPGTLMLVR